MVVCCDARPYDLQPQAPPQELRDRRGFRRGRFSFDRLLHLADNLSACIPTASVIPLVVARDRQELVCTPRTGFKLLRRRLPVLDFLLDCLLSIARCRSPGPSKKQSGYNSSTNGKGPLAWAALNFGFDWLRGPDTYRI